MSTVEEIEKAVAELPPEKLAALREWFEDYCEDKLELTDEVKAKLDDARADIREGRYKTRQPQ
jgi:ABC-type Zn uptake system ZnuABC Zn-binding protein ZnuA